MSKYTEQLWSDLAREHGATLAHTERSQPRSSGVLRHPRVLAGSTLGLAGIAAAVTIALGAAADPQPAFAVTRANDGSVQVQLNYKTDQNLPQVNAKLASMGTGEQVSIVEASGPATTSGPVTCSPQAGVSGPQVTILEGKDGTEVISPGESAGNTAEGTFHLASCTTYKLGSSGNSGASGPVVTSPGPNPVRIAHHVKRAGHGG